MPIVGDEEIFGEAGIRAREAILDVAGDSVFSIVEYDERSYNALYVSDAALSLYASEEQMWEHWEHLHSYVHLDFTEQQLFQEELLPDAGGVAFLATGFELQTVIRVLYDRQGLFVSILPTASTDDVIAAVKDVLG